MATQASGACSVIWINLVDSLKARHQGIQIGLGVENNGAAAAEEGHLELLIHWP